MARSYFAAPTSLETDDVGPWSHSVKPTYACIVLPTTDLGRWSLWAIAGFGLLLGFFAIAVAAGQRGGDEFFDNLWLTLPMLAAFACAVASLIVGVIAIVTKGERSILVMASTIIGLLVAGFGVAEVAFPH